jgi:hypothetical protein
MSRTQVANARIVRGALAAVTIAGAVAAGGSGGQASASTAIEPAASFYVSPFGSYTSGCTKTAPCRTFDRAYGLAKPGQVVEMAGGTYGSQTIPFDSTKTSSADVVFRPAVAATVVVAGILNVDGKHVELRGLRATGGWYARKGAQDVTFRDVSAPLIGIQSATQVSVLGGEVGPWLASSDGDPKIAKSSSMTTLVPTDILIDGVRFHDIVRPPGSGYHVECLQVGAAVNLTIRNSRFERCATHGLLVASWYRGYPLRNVLVENNVFGATMDGYHALKVNVVTSAEPCQNCTIRANTSAQPIAVNVDRTGSTISVRGNSTTSADLSPPGWCDHGRYGVFWDGNTFASRPTCGVNATVLP